jgi:UDP-3-O-[3-hydroxymyristoyl] glucosamine N-acyltransferase
LSARNFGREAPCASGYSTGVPHILDFVIERLESRYLDEAELRDLGIRNVGKNVRVSEDATIVGLANIDLGSNIRIDSNVVILSRRGWLKVGDNVHLEPASSIVAHHGVSIGSYCTLSHGVRLFTASADYSGESFHNVFPDGRYQNPRIGAINLENHVIIGGNSVVMPGVNIGEGAAIGALSFVRSSLDPWGIYGGNPIRRLGNRSTKIRDIAVQIEAGRL